MRGRSAADWLAMAVRATVFHDSHYKTIADVECATVDWYNEPTPPQ